MAWTPCPICGKKLNGDDAYRKHTNTEHPVEIKRLQTTIDVETYTRVLAGDTQRLEDIQTIQAHLASVGPDRQDIPQAVRVILEETLQRWGYKEERIQREIKRDKKQLAEAEAILASL